IFDYWGDYDLALKKYGDALKMSKAIGDKFNESVALNSIGNIYIHLGNYTRALKYFEDSLKMAEKMKASKIEFHNLLSLANLYLVMDRCKEAKGFLDKAYNKAECSHANQMLVEVLPVLCDFLLKEKNFKRFETTAKTFRDLSKKLKSKKFGATINLLMGRYYTEIKDFKKAHRYLNKALEIFDEIGERLNVGVVYYYMGMLKLADDKKLVYRKLLDGSLEIFSSLGTHGWKKKVEKALKDIC
ncbi:unnamed protein product, partial [marine sediment metagenome]